MQKAKVVVCITTYNRVDCARINMEIIKLNYPNQWPIVHACSDASYEPYLEDIFIRRQPKPLQAGAFDLLKSSFNMAIEEFSPDYIVHLEADTWLMNQAIIEKYIALLSTNRNNIISSSSWSFDKSEKWKKSGRVLKNLAYLITRVTKKAGLDWHIGWKKSMASQFFIVKNTWEFKDLISTIPEPSQNEYLEKYLFSKITQRFGRKSIIWMREREPVHPKNRDFCYAMELFSQHFPSSKLNKSSLPGKKEVLESYPTLQKGAFMKKLLTSDNLEYYNPGAKRI